MNEHTPEPWASFHATTPGLGETVAIGRADTELQTFQEGICIITDVKSMNATDIANARRIVACVNACRGMSTDYLENVAPAGALIMSANREALAEQAMEVAIRERDEARAMVAELAKALRFYADPENWKSPSTGFALQYDPTPSQIMVHRESIARDALTEAML